MYCSSQFERFGCSQYRSHPLDRAHQKISAKPIRRLINRPTTEPNPNCLSVFIWPLLSQQIYIQLIGIFNDRISRYSSSTWAWSEIPGPMIANSLPKLSKLEKGPYSNERRSPCTRSPNQPSHFGSGTKPALIIRQRRAMIEDLKQVSQPSTAVSAADSSSAFVNCSMLSSGGYRKSNSATA